MDTILNVETFEDLLELKKLGDTGAIYRHLGRIAVLNICNYDLNKIKKFLKKNCLCKEIMEADIEIYGVMIKMRKLKELIYKNNL